MTEDTKPYDGFTAQVLSYLNLILNSLSIAGGVTVVIIILLATRWKRHVMNRFSIRFTFVISLIDILRGIIILLYTYIHNVGFQCSLISFLFHWLTLVYFFLHVSIAFNLHLIFIHGFKPLKKWENIYWIASFGFPTVLLIAPLIAGRFGRDQIAGYCELRDPESKETNIYLWTTFLSWSIASCIYCTVVVIVVILKLQYQASILEEVYYQNINIPKKFRNIKNYLNLTNEIEKLIKRISLYCIIPILTQSGYLIVRYMSSYTGDISIGLITFSALSSDLPGILNFIAFLLDPAFSAAISDIPREELPVSPYSTGSTNVSDIENCNKENKNQSSFVIDIDTSNTKTDDYQKGYAGFIQKL